MLNGHWKYDILTAKPRVLKETQERYWGKLFGRESAIDQRPVDSIRAPQWDILRPITEEEIANTISTMKTTSAAGPDGITIRLLRSCPTRMLSQIFNLWLFSSERPETLQHARKTLILKVPDAAEPSKFDRSPWRLHSCGRSRS